MLVGGVAQIALGAGQALLAHGALTRRVVALELTAWNTGDAAVLAGTLLGIRPLAITGGALLVLARALLIGGVRGAVRRPAWPLHLYRSLLVLVLVLVPVGLLLAALHTG